MYRLKFAFYVFVAFCVLTSFVVTYYKGYKQAVTEYEQQIKQLQLDNKQQLLEQEREYNIQVNGIMATLTTQLEAQKVDYENTINNLTSNDVRDTVDVNSLCNKNSNNSKRVSTKDNTSTIKCYTDVELLRKIKTTMAIANECDRLATQYNALLKVCNEK